MPLQLLFLFAALTAVLSAGNEIILEDFSNPQHAWGTLNDPVMGGQSYSKVEIHDGIATFSGKCAIVPFLDAPGFIQMVTGGYRQPAALFPDVSTCRAFKLIVKSKVDYSGYRVGFGKEHLPDGRYAMGYKAPLELKPSTDDDEFQTVLMPFDAFSAKWSDATGDIEVTCAEEPKYCPSKRWLQSMETFSLWAEGIEGEIELEVKSISAVDCASDEDDEGLPHSVDPPSTDTLPLLAMVKPGESTETPHFFAAFALASVVLAALAGVRSFSTKKTSDDYEEVGEMRSCPETA